MNSYIYKQAYLPNNLNLELFLRDNPPTFDYDTDKFRHILSLVYEIPAHNKNIRENCDYIPINSGWLSAHGVHECKDYLDYLVSHNILETDNQFIPRLKSKGYRFTKQYQTPVKVEQITKYTLLKAVDNAHSRKSKYHKGMEKKYSYLKKHLDSLTIDAPSAETYLANQLEEDTAKGYSGAIDRYNSGIVCTSKLANQEYYFTVDSTVGRLHTNLTNMPSALRNYVTSGSTELVSVDIKNSQPLLSGALLRTDFWQTDSSGWNNLNYYTFQSLSQPIPMFINQSQSNTFKIEEYEQTLTGIDVQSYLSLTKTGELYDIVKQQVLNVTGCDMPRDMVKGQILKGMYADNRQTWVAHMVAYSVFRTMFPMPNIVFDKIKERNYTTLSILLQRIEAIIVLDYVAKRVATELPDIPQFTIHDSIVVPVGYEDYVATVIREEMNKAIGILPTVKFDYWKPS